MNQNEKLIWVAVFAQYYGKRNTSFGAGWAFHDLIIASKTAYAEASDAVLAIRELHKRYLNTHHAQGVAWEMLDEMINNNDE